MSNPTKKTYYCLNAVRHNGKRYTTEIDLTADEAKPLLSAKAITKTNPNADADADAEAAKKAEAKAKKEQEAADKKAEAKKSTVVEPAPEASANTTEAPKAPTADAK